MSALPALRPYQAAMLEQGRALSRGAGPDGRASLLFQLATGGGKTLLGLTLALSHLARSPANRVLWFAHRDELVEQPLSKLIAYGAPVAALRPGEHPDASARITVASVQTVLARGLDVLPRSTLVLFDEARHYVSGPEWSIVASAVARDRHVIGLDATPSGDLTPLFRHLVQGPSVADLTVEGYLVPAVHLGPAVEQDGLASDPIDAYLHHVAPHRALLFARDGAHARALCTAAIARGVRAAVVLDRTPTAARRQALADYQRGALDLLVNVQCLTEGTDLPATAGIIIARKVGEEETWVQIGGRGLRPSPGKERCLVLDLHGQTWRLGLLSEPREWRLDGRGSLRASPDLPPCVTCPNCHALSPPSAICPGCGRMAPSRPPPRLTKAELKIIRQDRLARSGSEWERWQALVWEARAKGWKPQAPGYRFMQEYGRPARWRVDHVPPAPEGWTAATGGEQRRIG